MDLPAIIAIHGVGNHKPGEIKASLADEFQCASMFPEIIEYNWNSYVDLSLTRLRDARGLLSTTAESISQTANLPLKPSGKKPDGILFGLEQAVYHGVLRYLVAAGWTVLIVAPLAYLLATLPKLLVAGFSLRTFGWVPAAARWELFATVAATIMLFFVSSLRSLASLSVKPLWVSVRRIVLLLLEPVLLLLTIPFSAAFGSSFLTDLTGFLPMAAIGLLMSLLLSPLAGGLKQVLPPSREFYIWGGLVALAVLHVLLRRMWVGGILKVLLDIVRYMGSPRYRQTLQEELDKTVGSLKPLSGRRRILILAHSLGSVIAVDSLINSTVWKREDDVFLVTLGSPIRRFFLRFFPGYVFPNSVEQSAGAIARRIGVFSWVNIHRLWDYVGGGLNLALTKVGTEVCTGQPWRIFSSHTNYWHDDIVFGKLLQALEKAFPAIGTEMPSADPGYSLPELFDNKRQERIAYGAQRVGFALAVLLVVVGFVNFFQNRRIWIRSVNADVASVLKEGTDALAKVTYYQTIEGSGENSHAVDHFIFHFPEPYGEQPDIQIGALFDSNARRFDHQALAKFVLQNCTRAEDKRWWQVLRRRLSIPCTRTNIPIRFDAANPASFTVPGFPPKIGTGDIAGEWIGNAILAVFFAFACLCLFRFGVLLFRLFMGLEISLL
jgi:hypothetical protein